MRFLRTNTAVRLTVGPFQDKGDGVTPETALTVTSCKLTLMVDDANVPTLVLDTAPTASGGANDMVHVTGDDAGFYDLELAAANVNYLGRAMLAITDAANHCPVFHEFMILPAMVYDSLVLGTDVLQADVTQAGGTNVTATGGRQEVNATHIAGAAVSTSTAQLGVNVIQAAGTAWGSGAITNAALAANAISDAKVDPDVTIASVTGAVGSVTGAVGSVTGAVGSVTGAVGSVSGAVGSVTGNVGGNVAGSVASVTADVGITQAGADKVWGSAARSLTTFGTLVADVATAVWGAATRILTAGTNIVLAKGVGVTGFNDLSAAQVNTEADTALNDYDGPTNAELATALAAADDAVITAVATRASQTSVDDLPTNAELATALGTADDAVLSAIAALNNVSAADLAAALATYDGPTKAELDSAVALLATAANLALVIAKTNSLTFTVAGNVDANIQRINDVALVGTGVLGDEWDAS